MDILEAKRKLRAIRRLSGPVPHDTVPERLEKIAAIATGKADPSIVRPIFTDTLAKRIEEGQASRAQGNAADRAARRKREAEQADENERAASTGRDRRARGGRDRSAGGNDDAVA